MAPSTPLRRGHPRRGKAMTTAPTASNSEARKRRSKKPIAYVSVEVGSRARTSAQSQVEVKEDGEAGDEAQDHDTEDQLDEADEGGDGDEEEGDRVEDNPWMAPTKSEWNNPQVYRRFRFEIDQESVFEVNQYVWIKGDTSSDRSKTAGPSSGLRRDSGQWIGKIVRIRASGPDNVCIQVAWVYTSLEMIRDSGCRNPPTELQEDEVVMSNLNDIVSISTINDFAEVHELDETSFLQDVIPDGSLYYRSKLLLPGLNEYGESGVGHGTSASGERKTKKRKRSVFAPRKSKSGKSGFTFPVIEPIGFPTCVCGKRYQPYPMDAHPMVFCPESDCQKWYHTACLPSIPHAAPSEMEQLRGSGLGLFGELPWLDLGLGETARASGAGLLGDLGTPSRDDVDAEGIHDRSKVLIQASNGQSLGSGHLAQSTAAAESEAESRARLVVQVTRAAEESILRGTAESGITGSAKRVLSARELMNVRSTGAVGDKIWGEMAKAWAAEYHVEEESPEDDPEGAAEVVGKGEGGGQGGRKKSTGNPKKGQDRVAAAAAAQSHSHWRCPTCQNVI